MHTIKHKNTSAKDHFVALMTDTPGKVSFMKEKGIDLEIKKNSGSVIFQLFLGITEIRLLSIPNINY